MSTEDDLPYRFLLNPDLGETSRTDLLEIVTRRKRFWQGSPAHFEGLEPTIGLFEEGVFIGPCFTYPPLLQTYILEPERQQFMFVEERHLEAAHRQGLGADEYWVISEERLLESAGVPLDLYSSFDEALGAADALLTARTDWKLSERWDDMTDEALVLWADIALARDARLCSAWERIGRIVASLDRDELLGILRNAGGFWKGESTGYGVGSTIYSLDSRGLNWGGTVVSSLLVGPLSYTEEEKAEIVDLLNTYGWERGRWCEDEFYNEMVRRNLPTDVKYWVLGEDLLGEDDPVFFERLEDAVSAVWDAMPWEPLEAWEEMNEGDLREWAGNALLIEEGYGAL